jgi:hypothetical protein
VLFAALMNMPAGMSAALAGGSTSTNHGVLGAPSGQLKLQPSPQPSQPSLRDKNVKSGQKNNFFLQLNGIEGESRDEYRRNEIK